MPIHDWTRVFPGTFHHFHNAWITHLAEALNDGLLPDGFFALSEQHSGDIVPDVLTLTHAARRKSAGGAPSGGVSLAEEPPRVSLRMTADENATYRALQKTLTIRHRSGREIVALIEIVSPGNKSAQKPFEQFVSKSVSAIRQGIHVLVVDLFPPTRRDPHGVHGAIREVVGGDYEPPDDRPLTLASYLSDTLPEAFVAPTAIGASLPDMPLFLDVGRYIDVPLETTYTASYRGMPAFLQDVLEGRAASEWESAAESGEDHESSK